MEKPNFEFELADTLLALKPDEPGLRANFEQMNSAIFKAIELSRELTKQVAELGRPATDKQALADLLRAQSLLLREISRAQIRLVSAQRAHFQLKVQGRA